ncbi:MAG: S46 family peptidase [Chitinophagaceae bacterium]|nr:MAG: S46 family peptidase [Chitinophagaceae bacterium]
MKKLFVTIFISLSFLLKSFADEGMWLPLLLGQQVYNDMVKRGLKLSKEQLYSINKTSIKDAIVIFGGGCTGEIVSNKGLIFTNHHCGYDAIANASTVEHNYLRDGFYAKNNGEEIPTEGVSVQFLLSIQDVTSQVLDSLKGMTGSERAQRQARVLNNLNAQHSDASQNIEARISSLFKGNQFLVFVYQRYNDVRLVGTPPESIGKFGGDTDNWEWPRHTGDFSVFRVYTGKDGKTANFSLDNIPMVPKWFLPVSIKGFKDGDYAMIYGYPGGTNRYETSFGVKQKIDIDNPTLVKLRDMRLKHMFEQMKNNDSVKLQLASSYAGIANYWKFFDGETKQLIKYDVFSQKKKSEEGFISWTKGKPEYEPIFSEWEKAYEAWRPFSKHRMYINEGLFGSPLSAFAAGLQQVEVALVQSGKTQADVKKAMEAVGKAREEFLKNENQASDQKILGDVTRMFYQDVDQTQHPIDFYRTLSEKFGSLTDEQTFKKYAAYIFDNTMIFNEAKWNAFVANPDANTLQNDPAFAHATAFLINYQSKYAAKSAQFNSKNNELGRLYLKGILEIDPVKAKKMYPDATFTMRVSFGNVKSYRPRDGVFYDYVCTMDGVLQKYKKGDYEFDLPDNLLELAKKKDFGQYIDKQKNDLVISFITTNDITGGNSGSPVLDANGNLIGLAFDGNYEALSHKIAFDKDLNRTICVDVRYVLWCIDKLGGASNLINELKLVK